MRHPCVAFALLTTLLFGGCNRGPTVVQIDGMVTRQGNPVPNLHLNFIPEKGRPSWGVTDDAGRFTLHYDDRQHGAVVGKHKVFVAFRPRNPKEEILIQQGVRKVHPELRAILDKYGYEKSPLLVTIENEGQKVLLDLN